VGFNGEGLVYGGVFGCGPEGVRFDVCGESLYRAVCSFRGWCFLAVLSLRGGSVRWASRRGLAWVGRSGGFCSVRVVRAARPGGPPGG